MFLVTIDKKNPLKKIPIVALNQKKLDVSTLEKDCFKLIFLKKGTITIEINTVPLVLHSPVILCLDSQKKFTVHSNFSSDVQVILFDPCFINKNLDIQVLKKHCYGNLCEQHAFFSCIHF